MGNLNRIVGGMLLLAGFSCGRVGAAVPNGDLLIQRERVGKLSVGMLAADVWKCYPRGEIRGGFVFPEGMAQPVVEIRLSPGQKEPSLVLTLDETRDHRHTVVKTIGVFDQRFRIKSGIGPGSTIARVRGGIEDLTIESFEGVTSLASQKLMMSFVLDLNDAADQSLYDSNGEFKPVSALSGEIRIQSVWVG